MGIGCGDRTYSASAKVSDPVFARYRDMIRSDARQAIGVPQLPESFELLATEDGSGTAAEAVLLISVASGRPGGQRWRTTFERTSGAMRWKSDAIQIYGPRCPEGPDGPECEYVALLVTADEEGGDTLRVERVSYSGPRGEFVRRDDLALHEVEALIRQWMSNE